MALLFEQLRVYQLAMRLAEGAIAVADRLPRGNAALADQLRRAATSIPLNIAEGAGRVTAADKMHFFAQARGSVLECVPALALLSRHIPVDDYRRLRSWLELLAKMLSAMIAA